MALAERMQQLGASVTVVFVQSPWPLAKRLAGSGIKHVCVGLAHGRDVVEHPRRYAAAVTEAGPDGALLLECGFMGATLRGGGYRGAIVAVEHGALLGLERFSTRKRLAWKADENRRSLGRRRRSRRVRLHARAIVPPTTHPRDQAYPQWHRSRYVLFRPRRPLTAVTAWWWHLPGA